MVLTLFALVMGFLLRWLEEKLQLVRAIGGVLWSYGVGILWGFVLGTSENDAWQFFILVGLTLLIMPLSLRRLWVEARHALPVFTVSVGSLLISALVVQLFVSTRVTPLFIAVWIGGTPNLLAVGKAMNLPASLILQANLSDMVLGSIYFGGILLMRAFRPEPPKQLRRPFSFLKGIPALGVGFAWAGFLALMASQQWLSLPWILGLLGIGALALGQIPVLHRKAAQALPWADAFIYAFCIGLGSRVHELTELSIFQSPIFWQASLILVAFLGLYHGLTYRYPWGMRVAISLGCIFSPAFVPAGMRALRASAYEGIGVLYGTLGYALANPLALVGAFVLEGFS
ncbi:MAG: hypothetical protein ACUVRD_01080 [Bacteroidia bacterium]